MHCIFCLRESKESDEHVFPAAIGGCIVIDRVCGACNSFLGAKIDVELTDYFPIKATRARLKLAGNSGKVPDLAMDIFGGVGTLAGKPDHKIITRINERSKKFDTHLLPIISDVDMGNGIQVKGIRADIRDMSKLIERERKRAGKPPFSADEIDKIIDTATPDTIVNPEILYSVKIDIDEIGVKKALLKIVYELAWRWLGDDYLIDPMAERIRNVIMRNVSSIDDEIKMNLSTVAECPPLQFWSLNKDYHIAFAMRHKDDISFCIKIFDDLAAAILVTNNAKKYLAGSTSEKLRFLVIDPVNGLADEMSFIEAVGQVARQSLRTAR